MIPKHNSEQPDSPNHQRVNSFHPLTDSLILPTLNQELEKMCLGLLHALQIPLLRQGSEYLITATVPQLVQLHKMLLMMQEYKRNFSSPSLFDLGTFAPGSNPEGGQPEPPDRRRSRSGAENEPKITRSELSNGLTFEQLLSRHSTGQALDPSNSVLDLKIKNEETGSANPEEPSSDKISKEEKNDTSLTEKFNTKLGIGMILCFNKQCMARLTIRRNSDAEELVRSVEGSLQNNSRTGFEVEGQYKTSSTYLKNFPKMLGDLFAKFLASQKIEANEIFKDKTSWKLLNGYLQGTFTIEGVSGKVLIQLFLQFLSELTIEQIEKAKIKEKGVKTCYSVLQDFLAEGAKVIRRSSWIESISSMAVKKVWPSLEICVKWEEMNIK